MTVEASPSKELAIGTVCYLQTFRFNLAPHRASGNGVGAVLYATLYVHHTNLKRSQADSYKHADKIGSVVRALFHRWSCIATIVGHPATNRGISATGFTTARLPSVQPFAAREKPTQKAFFVKVMPGCPTSGWRVIRQVTSVQGLGLPPHGVPNGLSARAMTRVWPTL